MTLPCTFLETLLRASLYGFYLLKVIFSLMDGKCHVVQLLLRPAFQVYFPRIKEHIIDAITPSNLSIQNKVSRAFDVNRNQLIQLRCKEGNKFVIYIAEAFGMIVNGKFRCLLVIKRLTVFKYFRLKAPAFLQLNRNLIMSAPQRYL